MDFRGENLIGLIAGGGYPQYVFIQESQPTAIYQGQLWVKPSTGVLSQADATLIWVPIVPAIPINVDTKKYDHSGTTNGTDSEVELDSIIITGLNAKDYLKTDIFYYFPDTSGGTAEYLKLRVSDGVHTKDTLVTPAAANGNYGGGSSEITQSSGGNTIIQGTSRYTSSSIAGGDSISNTAEIHTNLIGTGFNVNWITGNVTLSLRGVGRTGYTISWAWKVYRRTT